MALQSEVTKVSVSEQMHKLWNITLNLTCWPEGVIKEYPIIVDGTLNMKNAVIYENFSIRYRTGQDPEVKVKEVSEDMQAAIDQYKTEKQLFEHTKLDTAVTWLQNNLEG